MARRQGTPSRLRIRLRALLRRGAVESELDEELRYHLDKLRDENLARGMSAEEALADARKSFGGVEQAREECRDARGTRWLEDLVRDLGYGLRSLRRSPGFTALVVACLGIGIGANLTVFSLYNAVLLRPLRVQDPAHLVRFADGMFGGVSQDEKPDPGRVAAYSYPLYQHLRDHPQVQRHFTGLAAQQSGNTTSLVRWSGAGDRGAQTFDDDAVGRAVSAGYFQTLGVSAARGRTFLPDDETAPGANPVLVLSYQYWQRRFGGDPALIGGQLTVNGTRYTAVGVTAADFRGATVGEGTDFWVPLTMQGELMRGPRLLAGRQLHWLLLVGRRRPEVSLPTAEAAVNVVFQQYLAQDGALDQQQRQAVRIGLESARLGLATPNQHTRHLLAAVMVGVGLFLLIVCLNLSQLLMARAMDRHREMSIRAALGAGSLRLMRQLLTEGLLLSSLGLLAAAMVARGSRLGLVALVDDGTPPAVDFSADARVWGFFAALGLVTFIVLGLVPASRVGQGNLQEALRTASRAVTGGRARRLFGRALLTSQVAFSLVLLVAAALLTASLGRLRDVDKGFDDQGVLLVDVNPRMLGLARERLGLLYDDILRRVMALPGVRGASLSQTAVLGNCCARDNIVMAGQPRMRAVQIESVTPGFFETLGMTIAHGRGFSAADHDRAPLVVIINQTLARRLFGQTDVVGRRFRFEHFPPPARGDLEVVGVVKDGRTRSLREAAHPAGYLPVAQRPDSLGTLQVRTDGDSGALAADVRRALRQAHPGLPVAKVRTMRTQASWSFTSERILAVLSSSFGLAALLVVCIGLYGVISQWASQRTQEIGVRLALGATLAGVRWMVLRQALTYLLAGIAVGLPVAVAATRLLQGLLFGLTPTDPRAMVGAVFLVLAVASVAAFLPARRASRIDPMSALRCE
jgi:predicted permease